jgi:hypothetical protein
LNDGAPPGEYAVTFKATQPRKEDEDEGGPEVDRFQGRYSNPESSLWIVTIVEGENELEPFQLK